MVTVAGNSAPSVSVTSPAAGATFTAPATIPIAASASDPDGGVAKVEFFDGTTKLGEDTDAPYTFDWADVGVGTYSVTARATDTLGAQTTSAVRTVTVGANTGPSVSITAPAAGAPFTAPANVGIAASASDPQGIASVEFFNGATSLGIDTTAPYSYDWVGVGAGTYSITARATDSLGAQTTSAEHTVTVSPPAPVNQPPTTSISFPLDNASFAWKPTIEITATASDPDGSVSRVEFLRNDGATLMGTDTSAPYSHRWKNVPVGSHVLRVRAYDDRGTATTSSAVRITVRPK
jgi:hypothetical protein